MSQLIYFLTLGRRKFISLEDIAIKKFISLLVTLTIILNLFAVSAAAATRPSFGAVRQLRGSLNEYKINKTSMSVLRPKVQLEKTPYSKDIDILVSDRVRKRIDKKLLGLEKEIIMLAQLIYTEAGGIKLGLHHQAAVVWCVLNRVDSTGGVSSISAVIKYPNAFAWYSTTKVEPRFYELAKDVVARWLLEHEGYTDVGRVLPREYMYFHGADGVNKFKIKNNSKNYWDWSLGSPYSNC